MTTLRIATFNVENFDETVPNASTPSLADRIAVMRPQLERLRADILCLQEVHGQERPGQPRALLALAELLSGTKLAGANIVSTQTANGEVFDQRNLVLVTSLTVTGHTQLLNTLVAAPIYQMLTADPPAVAPQAIRVERPILHVELNVDGAPLHVIVVHLKSKLPTDIPGQKLNTFTWRSAGAAAEGSFISSMKRMSQALEVRRLVDQILDQDPNARIVVGGDFNATAEEVPLVAIRGDVEDTGNGALAGRVLVPLENTIPESARYSLFHQGKGQMLDHILVTRNLLAHYRGAEIHNELLHDESGAFATDVKYPESDHAPVVVTFDFA
ncbi:endonuclease/exonuclease/phosphatase family protein [Nocardia sp. NPDC004604]|uniref:endonuclease/exonuclease/phosphatase family protein n=1 Tax=Nocardia sp. NPDC004604 TaxID=3157013 RepID=UPI0033A435DC